MNTNDHSQQYNLRIKGNTQNKAFHGAHIEQGFFFLSLYTSSYISYKIKYSVQLICSKTMTSFRDLCNYLSKKKKNPAQKMF